MHEAALASAALPAPTAILGLELRPYSLGHELFLIRERNPLALHHGNVDGASYSELALAVLICGHGWEENVRLWRDPLIGLKLWLWHWRTRRRNIPRELRSFREYQAEGSREFPISPLTEETERSAPSRVPGAPLLLRAQQFLTTRLGLGQEAAWDYPYGLALMQYETWWESEGGLKILNGQEHDHLEYVERMEREAELGKCGARSSECGAGQAWSPGSAQEAGDSSRSVEGGGAKNGGGGHA